MNVRAVFFGSSDSVFSSRHFAALAEAGCVIAAVVDVPPSRRSSTNSARPVGQAFVEAAARAGIPRFEPGRPNSQGFVDDISALRPDVFLAVGYMLLLGPRLLAVPRVLAANFHASLLPAYRGKHPVFWALRNNEPWCGLTVHEMSPRLDGGDIIYQVRVPTRAEDSVSVLYERIMAESVGLVSRLVADVAAGRVPRAPQPEQGASYFGATTEEDFRIRWSMEAGRISRWVRATPGQCFLEVRGQRVYLLDAAVQDAISDAEPGTLLELTASGWRVAARGGVVDVRVLGAMPAELGVGPGAQLGEP